MKPIKITSLNWWSTLKVILKYSSYIIIIFEGISSIMNNIESKEGGSNSPLNNSDNA